MKNNHESWNTDKVLRVMYELRHISEKKNALADEHWRYKKLKKNFEYFKIETLYNTIAEGHYHFKLSKKLLENWIKYVKLSQFENENAEKHKELSLKRAVFLTWKQKSGDEIVFQKLERDVATRYSQKIFKRRFFFIWKNKYLSSLASSTLCHGFYSSILRFYFHYWIQKKNQRVFFHNQKRNLYLKYWTVWLNTSKISKRYKQVEIFADDQNLLDHFCHWKELYTQRKKRKKRQFVAEKFRNNNVLWNWFYKWQLSFSNKRMEYSRENAADEFYIENLLSKSAKTWKLKYMEIISKEIIEHNTKYNLLMWWYSRYDSWKFKRHLLTRRSNKRLLRTLFDSWIKKRFRSERERRIDIPKAMQFRKKMLIQMSFKMWNAIFLARVEFQNQSYHLFTQIKLNNWFTLWKEKTERKSELRELYYQYIFKSQEIRLRNAFLDWRESFDKKTFLILDYRKEACNQYEKSILFKFFNIWHKSHLLYTKERKYSIQKEKLYKKRAFVCWHYQFSSWKKAKSFDSCSKRVATRQALYCWYEETRSQNRNRSSIAKKIISNNNNNRLVKSLKKWRLESIFKAKSRMKNKRNQRFHFMKWKSLFKARKMIRKCFNQSYSPYVSKSKNIGGIKTKKQNIFKEFLDAEYETCDEQPQLIPNTKPSKGKTKNKRDKRKEKQRKKNKYIYKERQRNENDNYPELSVDSWESIGMDGMCLDYKSDLSGAPVCDDEMWKLLNLRGNS
eukprot:gb/GECH01004677.1/.p1 GENE.gb/GECH01004677.1/~~gb/GECH01004677.1/.p1  ORF type:complete len:731 (+),score=112.84 gb/GECH01004677.1/:1-2193(+)